MFGWFRKTPPKRSLKEEAAFAKGQEFAEQMMAAFDEFNAYRVDRVAKNYLGVLRDALKRTPEHEDVPPLISARIEYDNFLQEVAELEPKLRAEVATRLEEWYGVADVLDMRDAFQNYVDKQLRDKMILLSSNALTVLAEEAEWLIPLDDAFRLKHPDKSKQFPRPQ